MSAFDELQNSTVVQKKEEIEIEIKDKKLKFFANEITYLQRLHLQTLQISGNEAFTQLVIYSITDEDGSRMTKEQVDKLPNEIIEKFFIAATKVNSVSEVKTEKN